MTHTDLVAELRIVAKHGSGLARQAADEIERLRGGAQARPKPDVTDELDRLLTAYLGSLDGGQNQAANEAALHNALWDNKAEIIACLKALK